MPTIPPGTRTPIDDDGDGTIDRIEFDFDEDGNIDRTVHLNADGGWERVERDDDDDGTIDRTVHRNTDGSRPQTINRIDFDDDGDGTTDRSVLYTHNADNNRTRTEFDDDGDGTTDRSEDYIYNSIGNRTRTNFDDNNDGTTDRSEDYAYFNGRLSRTRFDDDEDNTFDRSETYTYDENGNQTGTEFDDDGDNTPDRREAYTYDENGNRIQTGFDTDADGNIDRITHYAFDGDGNGRVTRRDADLDDDGAIDRTVHLNADGRWERVERDDDGDGTIDRTVYRNTDGSGTINRIDFDNDGDGTTDRSVLYTHNADNNRTRTEFDDDGDGTIDRTVHLNADGRWERVERDLDDDGTIDRTVHRNTDGSRPQTINRIDFDDDGDGTTDRSQFFTQNTDNNRNRASFDDDADGTIDRNETYTYDVNDRVSQTSFDDDNDSTTDRIETYTYDDDGNRTRTDFDDDNDGTTDRSEDYSYFSGTLSRTDFDDDEDGTTDRSETYTYDVSGNRIQTNFDDDNDGTIDRIERYTVDDDGNLTRTSFDDDADGTPDRSETYTYSANGRVSQTGFDDDADGTTDRSEAYTYYGNGRVSQTRFDDDADDTIDRSESYTYDANGRVSQTRFDDDGDGTTDRIERALSSLDGSNGFILNGIDAGDQSGVSVSSAGDVNGDGYDDLVIGANRAYLNRDRFVGETYVVYGGANAPGTEGELDLSMLDGTNGFILTGIDAFDYSGFSVSSAGDVNGDGYDDLVIGVFGADPNGDSRAGETYVVYGGASAPGEDGVLDLSDLDGTNGFILNGIDAVDYSGISVSSAGDVNGDGYDDLIIGAYRADSSAGETYVIYGGANAPGTDGVLDLSRLALDGNGFILAGIDAGDRSGSSVSSAGDVNGDGYDDLIIGANRADSSAGETYVIYGGANAPGSDGILELSGLDGTNGFILTGIDAGDHSGVSVSSAGDVNGDGYDDLIIGASGADPNGDSSAGETYVVYGGASAPGSDGVLDLSALDGTNGFTLTGIDVNDVSGFSVSSAGDVNGDGYDDLIIGANRADPNGDSSGETYVIYGGASAPGSDGVLDLGALDGSNGFILNGIDADDVSGTSVSSAGDVNGDGYDDLIIGATGADGAAGETYVVYGGATGTESLVPLTASGTAAADNFTGNAGADSFTGIATDDVVRGGAGDDTIRVTALDFAAIDGGTGADTLVLDGAGLSLDLTGAGHAGVDSVEVFDLSGTGANTLVLDAQAVFDLTEEREDGIASLDVLGDADDSVDLGVSNFALTGTVTEDGVTYNVYRDGNAQLRVETGVQVVTIPVFTSPATVNAAENQRVAYEAAVTDADGDALVYSLSGTDAALFTIDANTGEVSFIAAPDFEMPGDNDGDNVYDITVTASDGDNNTNHNVAITVTNENDNIPVFTSPAAVSVAENRMAAYEAVTTDADGDTLVYSLSGTDAALFTIDANTGEVSFIAAPDFEVPDDGDGDNVYDITVTAFDGTNRTNHNVAITVTDEYDLIPLSSLDGSNGFILNGIDAGDFSGISVSSAGDVNGDGYDDLIIGANSADPNGDDNAGATYIVYGGASAPGTDGMLDLSGLDGTNGFTLTGIDASDRSGFSVSSAGDVNGDGYDDLIIGANRADPNGRSSAGETYVVYGGANAPGTGGVLDLGALDGSNGFILAGSARNDQSGRSVSSAGDVNGDGYDDLIIGADLADPNGNNYAGATYVIYGGANAPGSDGVLDLSDLDGTNGFILTGIEAYDFSGVSVSSAGDVNGDGYDDLIIGANSADPNGNSNAGETYVVYGGASAPGTGGVLDLSALDGTNGFILNGIDANDQSGRSVSSAGDVNGDGYDDLVIGANRADPNGDSEAGETYVVYGGANAPGTGGVLDLGALDGTNGFTLTGIDANDRSGRSVSSAGDVNGDGYDDLIIGAYFADPDGDSAGETYVIYGGASAPGTGGVLDLSDLDGTNGFVLTGINAGDQSGRSVASAGDVNGDGYDDLVIGAHMADPDGDMSAGETYILYGGATGTESLVSIMAQGTAAADNFTGNAGADSFTAIATDDVVRGGAGDDRISITALDFAAIDGGTGVDTLVLDGANLALDLTGAGHAGVDSVEVFDLSGTGANTLVLDAQAVFDVTEEREGGVASLDVLGDADDRVDLSGSSFALTGTVTEDGTTYHVYRDGNAQVRVETGVQVQIPVTTTPPVFTSPAAVSVAENRMAAYEAVATDADGDALVYSLSGTDAALFTIDATTGEVSFITAPDFEAPGDDGGDNVYDIIVTASDGTNSTNHNVAITVTDVNDLVPLSSLDGSNGFILNGIDSGDYSGISVSSAGDVNGDGYDDLIIGAIYADPNGSNSGETYIVYGGANAPGTGGRFNLSTLDGTNGFILNGIDETDLSGFSVSSAGDVNGDGYDDLIIGAYLADPNGDSNAGETYIVYGGASAPGTGGRFNLSTLDGSNGFILTGIDANDQSGRSVSSAGDVNGDGYDDLIIGANGGDPNGETYVIYGGANAPGSDGVLDLSALDGTNGFILTGIDANDFSGRSVSSAGDVNGDGYDDLIIGANRADPNGDGEAGETYIVYGGASAPGTGGRFNLSTLDGTNGFILNGIDAYDRSGTSVSSAGDVNGDGYDDLIIGAYGADGYAGEIYVVYGGANAPGTGGVLDLSALNGTNGFTLTGIDAGDRSGSSVSSAGDVNGDGYDDLIIGARNADPNGNSNAGETYLVYGGANAPGSDGVLDLSDLDGTNGFILTGIDAGDRSGRSVSSAGDVNGDGYDDLIIGASGADPNGRSSLGETYVVYGGATGTESLTPVTAQGTAAADNFTGNAGNDSFTAIATNDVVRGGAGDDNISVTALDFAAIDGGTGVDTLVLDGAGLALDLTGAGHAGVDSVEVFDLSGTGANSLVLDAQAVFDVTEEREGSAASLDVLGDADDRVDLGGGNFILTGTVTEDGVTYNVYRDGNAQVRVEDGVSVTLAAAGSQSARSLTADPDLMPDLSHADAREGIDGTGLHSLGHSPGMDVDFMDGFSESEFEWTGVVVTGLAPPDMQAPAPGPLSPGQAINPFDALTGYDLSYDLLL